MLLLAPELLSIAVRSGSAQADLGPVDTEMVQPILEEEHKRREKARKKRELREWLISEARIEEQFVDGKHMPLFDALGIHCKDELARLAKSPRFDELTGIAEFSKRRILRAFKMPVRAPR